jgi:hypothetical protein
MAIAHDMQVMAIPVSVFHAKLRLSRWLFCTVS